MSHTVRTIVSLFILSTVLTSVHAQTFFPTPQRAFRKGCLLLSISEGSTTAHYTTGQSVAGNSELPVRHTCKMDGVRDPLFVEFGLTDRWGIGLSSGNDIFNVNPSQYYGFHLSGDKNVSAKTSEFTFDVNYHLYTGRKTDLSLYTSIGSFGVAFSGKEGDYNYNYNAKGGIIRFGGKARYYFFKRLGVLGMISYYSGSASPSGIKSNTVAEDIHTNIKGYALEFGLCFRFL